MQNAQAQCNPRAGAGPRAGQPAYEQGAALGAHPGRGPGEGGPGREALRDLDQALLRLIHGLVYPLDFLSDLVPVDVPSRVPAANVPEDERSGLRCG